MLRRSIHLISCFPVFGAVLSALACNETVDVPSIELGNDTIAETGYPVNDIGSGEIDPGVCLTETKPGAYGIQYQCQGWINMELSWTYDEVENSFSWPETDPYNDPPLLPFYGVYESYGAAYVRACCGEFQGDIEDPDDFLSQPEFGLNCLVDAREQACISLDYALAKKVQQLNNPFNSNDERQALEEVWYYVGANIQECWGSLGEDFPLVNATWHAADWVVDNAWVDGDLENVNFRFDSIVSGVYAPETGYETCENLHENDTVNIPLEWPGKFSIVQGLTLDAGDGTVDGPGYGGGTITAADDFESEMTSCTSLSCSRAAISMSTTDDWAIDQMVLNVAGGDLIFGNGYVTEKVTNARLELYGPAIGAIVPGIPPIPTQYVVPAGGAHFLVVGKADGDDEWVMLPVVTSTAITATELAGEWTFDPFEIEYTDDSSDLWTITVNETVWLED